MPKLLGVTTLAKNHSSVGPPNFPTRTHWFCDEQCTFSIQSSILSPGRLAKEGTPAIVWSICTKRAPSALGRINTLRAAPLNASILALLAGHWVAANVEQIAALSIFEVA